MTNADFQTLTELALLDVCEALARCSKSDLNRAVYAIALMINGIGDIPVLCINGEMNAPSNGVSARRDLYQERYEAYRFKLETAQSLRIRSSRPATAGSVSPA